MTYTKEKQLYKAKKKNPKKLNKSEIRSYKSAIIGFCDCLCQLCGKPEIHSHHHAVHKPKDGGKDDRTLVALCYECHHEIHHGIKGIGKKLDDDCVPIGRENWFRFSGERI